jgi:hypothetical protein
VLLIVLLAITDKHNGPATPGIVSVGLFLVILGLGASLGMETSELFSFVSKDVSNGRGCQAILSILRGISVLGY